MGGYVIIGGGVAGVSCVEGIRSTDPTGSITLASAEANSNYGRPLISYLLEGVTDPARMSYRGEDFYERMGVTALHGVSASVIDARAKTVTLSDGRVLDYDALCVATGSSPFVPPLEGLETVPRRFTFMTLADAMALGEEVREDTRVLVVGGGLIGLKCAEGLRATTRRITVCDLAPHVLSSILVPDASKLVERHLESEGITLMLGRSVQRFEGTRADMTDGSVVDFDVLVLAIGVRPNVSLVAGAGGATRRGIVVDERMQTTLEGVFAAGDCVESHNLVTGADGPIAILPNASMQGWAAGVNMAGGNEHVEDSIPMNSMGILGLHIMTAGSYTDEQSGGRTILHASDSAYRQFFMKDGMLSGFILVGDVSRAGIYTALIRERRELGPIESEELWEKPSLIALGRSWREQRLGGVV